MLEKTHTSDFGFGFRYQNFLKLPQHNSNGQTRLRPGQGASNAIGVWID